jgi:carboxylate-amine ligase
MAAARLYLPLLLALSASSPFWVGRDTGMASYRSAAFAELPRTGIPDAFASGAEYLATLNALVDSGAIDDPTKVWWDIRAHPRLPTLEYRVCDMTPRPEHVIAIAALCQALTQYLIERLSAGDRLPIAPRLLIAENKWRAARDGLAGSLIDLDTGQLRPTPDLIHEMLDRLKPAASELGSREALRGIEDIVQHGNSADRQRKALQQQGTLAGVVDNLAQESLARESGHL